MATGVVGDGICRHRLPAPRHQFDDLAAADHETALGVVSENRKGIPDPDRLRLVHNPT